ncbi:MAG: ABC transporter permease [Rhodospirillales bacterium]|nr:ABC transporter permease [Rhodospirillales bacterium]MDE2198247.1 ABC transporter permease [Rhodospirillales bacterium]MDE2576320.1 ABC transporter permease [Rhodospirillales bacterium]
MLRWLPLLLLAAAWEAAPRLGLVSPSLLPPFSRALAAFWQLARDGDLFLNAAQSLWRLAAGLALAVVGGIGLGALMAWYRPVDIVAAPLVRSLYPMPKSALIPVLLLWFGLGDASKIALIFLGCLLPVLMSTYNGVRGVEITLIWSARSLGRSPLAVLFGIALPAAMPDILAGLRTALALSFVLLVSSEFLMAKDGLGYLISFLGDGGAYPAMFATVLAVALLGFAADRAFLLLTRRMLAWRG